MTRWGIASRERGERRAHPADIGDYRTVECECTAPCSDDSCYGKQQRRLHWWNAGVKIACLILRDACHICVCGPRGRVVREQVQPTNNPQLSACTANKIPQALRGTKPKIEQTSNTNGTLSTSAVCLVFKRGGGCDDAIAEVDAVKRDSVAL